MCVFLCHLKPNLLSTDYFLPATGMQYTKRLNNPGPVIYTLWYITVYGVCTFSPHYYLWLALHTIGIAHASIAHWTGDFHIETPVRDPVVDQRNDMHIHTQQKHTPHHRPSREWCSHICVCTTDSRTGLKVCSSSISSSTMCFVFCLPGWLVGLAHKYLSWTTAGAEERLLGWMMAPKKTQKSAARVRDSTESALCMDGVWLESGGTHTLRFQWGGFWVLRESVIFTLRWWLFAIVFIWGLRASVVVVRDGDSCTGAKINVVFPSDLGINSTKN